MDITGSKNIKTTGLKSVSSKPDENQLVKINKFTRRNFTADELYIGKIRLANNAIDRDVERFSEEILKDFEKTIVGKNLLLDHNKYNIERSAKGTFFDAEIEIFPLSDGFAQTGENLKLPEGMTEVQFLVVSFYIAKDSIPKEEIIKIDAGIYSNASIGFYAESKVSITDKNGAILYREYRSKGEAYEGSLVYMGAQFGAAIKKGVSGSVEKTAVTFSATTAADDDKDWDANSAKKRLAKWASSDDSGDKDKIDWAKYRKGFAWYDSNNSEDFDSYKLPHHDTEDDKIVVIWKGVSAAMAALLGARGGVDLPDDEKDAVYNHLAKHYAQFDREPPEKESKALLKEIEEKGGNKKMLEDHIKQFSKIFDFKFTEEDFTDEMKAIVDTKDEKIKELEPLAADGKAYRDGLVSEYVILKTKIGDINEEPEKHKMLTETASKYPIEFLKSEVDVLQKRVEEKFPAEAQIKGDTLDDSRDGNNKKKNPLVPKEVK